MASASCQSGAPLTSSPRIIMFVPVRKRTGELIYVRHRRCMHFLTCWHVKIIHSFCRSLTRARATTIVSPSVRHLNYSFMKSAATCPVGRMYIGLTATSRSVDGSCPISPSVYQRQRAYDRTSHPKTNNKDLHLWTTCSHISIPQELKPNRYHLFSTW